MTYSRQHLLIVSREMQVSCISCYLLGKSLTTSENRAVCWFHQVGTSRKISSVTSHDLEELFSQGTILSHRSHNHELENDS